MRLRSLVVTMLILFMAPLILHSEVPKTLNYQGVLTNADGTVVPDGNYLITFKIYSVSTGGTPLWQEAKTVTVSKGVFNTVLGHITPLNLDFSVPYYLGISVGGGAELTPRVELTAAPYSFSSNLIKGTNYLPATGRVGIGKSNPGYMLDIDGADYPYNQVGIMYTGYNDYWNSIYVRSATPTGKPAYGYLRENLLKASTFVDTTNYWVLRVSGSDIVKVTPAGRMGIGGHDPAEALDVDGAIRIGNTDRNNAGTIRWTGTDFEGYDGTSWKSLTAAGGGSLPSGMYGQTLVHNGANWVANSNLYNNGAHVGIGTTTPDARLDILGGNWDLDNTGGDLKIGNDTYRLKIGVATDGGGAGTAGIRMQGGLQRIIVGGGSKEVVQIDTTGSVTIGSNTVSGALSIKRSGLSDNVARIYSNSYGGNFDLRDESGNVYAYIQGDINGSGAFLYIYGGSSSSFMVDGNYSGTQNVKVSILGNSDIVFNSNATGDDAVLLPGSSVSAPEILDEPGVANARSYTSSPLSMNSTGYYTLAMRTMVAPTDGYVIAIGSCFTSIGHNAGTNDYITFGVSDLTYFGGNPIVEVEVPSGAGTGNYRIPATVTGVFSVTAGSHTFRFLGYLSSGTCNVFDANITLMFIPTTYGPISSTLIASSDKYPVDNRSAGSEEKAEMAEAERANMERLQREIEELRKKVEALESGNGQM